MMRVTAQHPVLTLDKRTPVWQVSAQEGIRRPGDAEGGVRTTGQQGQGRHARRIVPRLRVSYWGDWVVMRTSWGLGFRVREGGGVLNRVFFSQQLQAAQGEMEVSLDLALLRVVLRVG